MYLLRFYITPKIICEQKYKNIKIKLKHTHTFLFLLVKYQKLLHQDYIMQILLNLLTWWLYPFPFKHNKYRCFLSFFFKLEMTIIWTFLLWPISHRIGGHISLYFDFALFSCSREKWTDKRLVIEEKLTHIMEHIMISSYS